MSEGFPDFMFLPSNQTNISYSIAAALSFLKNDVKLSKLDWKVFASSKFPSWFSILIDVASVEIGLEFSSESSSSCSYSKLDVDIFLRHIFLEDANKKLKLYLSLF